jgi:hypothetical protein
VHDLCEQVKQDGSGHGLNDNGRELVVTLRTVLAAAFLAQANARTLDAEVAVCADRASHAVPAICAHGPRVPDLRAMSVP